MRKLLGLIILLSLSLMSFGQPPTARSSSAVTAVDSRAQMALNLTIPRYQDTLQANLAANIGLDSIGSLIFTRVDNHILKRVCCPKKWVIIDSTGGGGSQNLQQVTNIDSVTTQSITAKQYRSKSSDPAFILKQSTTNQTYKIAIGAGNGTTGSNATSLQIIDSSTNKPLLIMGGSNIAIGKGLTRTTSIPNESSFYLFGGASGANIDTRPDSTSYDESNVEAESSNYADASAIGRGVAMTTWGNVGVVGSYFGQPLKNMSMVRFKNDYNVIGTLNNHSLHFGTNGKHWGLWDSTGKLTVDDSAKFQLQGNGAGANKVLTSDASGNATWQAPTGGNDSLNIPLQGTYPGKDVYGDIKIADGVSFLASVSDGGSYHLGDVTNASLNVPAAGSGQNKLSILSDDPTSAGIGGANDYSANITDLDYPQLIKVKSAIHDSLVAHPSGGIDSVRQGNTTDTIKQYSAGVGSKAFLTERVFNVKNFGAFGDSSHNDTRAIQSAIQAAYNAGGGTVYFPDGTYLIPDSLRTVDPNTGLPIDNSQLYLPHTSYANIDKMPTIKLLGESAPSPYSDWTAGQPRAFKGAVIKSTRRVAGGNVFGSPYSPDIWGDFNYTQLFLENITISVSSKTAGGTDTAATMSAMNAYHISMIGDVRNCRFITESAPPVSVLPATGTYGFRGPANNNFGSTNLQNVIVQGFYNGISGTEHFNGNELIISTCYNGLVMDLGFHASYIDKLKTWWNVNNIRINDASYWNINQIDIEALPSSVSAHWYNSVYDIYEPGSTGSELSGYFHKVTAFVGINDNLANSIISPRINMVRIGNGTSINTWTASGSDQYSNVTGNVGIGTTSTIPNKLTVRTDVTADGMRLVGGSYPAISLARPDGIVRGYAPFLTTGAGGFFTNSAENDMGFRSDSNDVIIGRGLYAIAKIGENVRVNTNTASATASASFEVGGTDKGSIPEPRMTGTQRNAIPSPAENLSVYNYTSHRKNFYNGTAWDTLATLADARSLAGGGSGLDTTAWHKSGDTGTNGGTNFLGTTDGQPLVMKTNSTTRFTIANGNSALFGSTSVTGSSTPFRLSMGGSYSTSAVGSSDNVKVAIFDDGTPSDLIGIGLSPSLMELYAGSGSGIGFFTNNGTEAFRANSSGNLAMTGKISFPTTGSPHYPLSMGDNLANTSIAVYDDGAGTAPYGFGVQSGQFRLHLGNSTARFSFLNAAAGTEVMTILGTGNVGVGNTTPTQAMDVIGNIKLSGYEVLPPGYFTPTTGSTISTTVGDNIIEPAGALLALTINLPTPVNGMKVHYTFTQAITTVTFANGTTVNPITTTAAGGEIGWQYYSGTNSWYKY